MMVAGPQSINQVEKFGMRKGRSAPVGCRDTHRRMLEHALVMPPIPDQVEEGDAIRTAGDRLAVDDAGPGLEPMQRIDDPGEPPGQVIARPAVELDALTLLAGDHPEAVMLDLVQPAVAGGRTLGRMWEGTAR